MVQAAVDHVHEGPGTLATAGSAGAPTQLLLCESVKTLGKADLGILTTVEFADVQNQLLLCRSLQTRNRGS